jgi:very-short-patch-repair endonuclease
VPPLVRRALRARRPAPPRACSRGAPPKGEPCSFHDDYAGTPSRSTCTSINSGCGPSNFDQTCDQKAAGWRGRLAGTAFAHGVIQHLKRPLLDGLEERTGRPRGCHARDRLCHGARSAPRARGAQILQLRRRPLRSFGRASRILRRGASPGHVDRATGGPVVHFIEAFVGSRRAPRAPRSQQRRHPTPSEHVLWQAIRGGRLGLSFRRQVPIGPYIVDFLAPRERLIVEVDRGYHTERASADQRRQRWLEKQGYRVLRLSAATVLHETAAAVHRIAQALSAPRGA